MLFVIDASVAGLFESGLADVVDIVGLDYLALGVAEGSHRIIGKRRVLTTLAGVGGLHWRTRRVLERAAQRVAQEGELHYRFHTYGLIVANAGLMPSSAVVGAQRVITLPLRWFDRSEKVQPTVLLGENLSDANVLDLVGEASTALGNLPYLPLRLCPDHGGGDSTGLVLALNATGGRPCVCIVDSDRSCPSGALGRTATLVQPFSNTANYPLVAVSETNGRDLENLLPDVFYQTAYGAHPDFGTMANLMAQLTQAGEVELRAHLDIEKGVTLRQIFNHAIGSQERIFWDLKLPILLGYLGIAAGTLPCLAVGACALQPPDPCTCRILRGIPQNILNRFFDSHRTATRYGVASLLQDSLHPEWLRLGTIVASWGFADEPLRI